MLFKLLFCGAILILNSSCEDITFKNVTIRAEVGKFNKTVESGTNLNDHLPGNLLALVHIEGSIPILYENSIRDIYNVQFIFLKGVGLTEIKPGAFKHLPGVIGIDFSSNNLTELKEGVFKNLTISELHFVHNQISVIQPKAFDDLPELVTIDLSSNKISQWDNNWFRNTPRIYKLYLAHNLIEELPEDAFKNIYTKREQWIKLNNNKIKKISPNAFRGVEKFDTLDLSSNKIENWSEDFLADAKFVVYLRLVGNKIKCLSGDFGKIFKAGVTYVYNNPWEQKCLKDVEKWVEDDYSDHVVCTTTRCSEY